MTFFSQGGSGIPVPGGGLQTFGTYLSSKVGESWSTQRLSTPQSFGEAANFMGTTPDQRFAFVETVKEGSGPEAGRGLYMIDSTTGDIQTIVPVGINQIGPPGYASRRGIYTFDGASPDGSRVLFETRATLTGNAAPGVVNLYLWSRSTGEVTLAGALPTELAPEGGSFGGAFEWYSESEEPYAETSLGGSSAGMAVQAVDAVTPDVNQVFFTEGETGQLYLRRGLAGPAPETIRVSAPNNGMASVDRPAAFQFATPDGDHAFFISPARLTSEATTGVNEEGSDLYRWDASTETVDDIAPDAADELGAQVQGVLGISEQGTSGYFVARGVLAQGAQAGAENLYRFDTSTSPTTFALVAILSSEPIDQRNWSPKAYGATEALAGAVQEENILRTSRITPDGQTLLFSSEAPLTGYDNASAGGFECYSGCDELFRYTAPTSPLAAGRLECVSCNPDGSRPLGSAKLVPSFLNGGLVLPGGVPAVSVPNNLSESGDQVFFQSPDSLVPTDTNSSTGSCQSYQEMPAVSIPIISFCQDVYEWEAAGTPGGSCTAPEVGGGCLYLLSTGKGEKPSFFAGASANGATAFIVTASQLVPEDGDTANDGYAVRVNGGLPSQSVQGGPGVCLGEDCFSVASAPPPSLSSGSEAIQGRQNATTRRTQKRRTRRHRKHRHHKKPQRQSGPTSNKAHANQSTVVRGGKG